MSKKIFMLLVVAAFIAGISGFSYAEMSCGDMDNGNNQNQQVAQSHSGHGQSTAGAAEQIVSKEVMDAGNKICPVSGENIKEETKATYEYKGKIYNFCCAMCIDDFKKDPQKYIEKVNKELQAESKEQSKHEEHEMGMMHGSETMQKGMHEGHQD